MTQPTICLFMIVKNEAGHMPRLIANVTPLIDFALICDTGSSDATIALTEDALRAHGIPGRLLTHEWRNFGHNRTLAINAARGHCDYLLTLDADCELQFEADAGHIREQLATGLDEYTVTLEHGPIEYRRSLLFRDDPRIDWHCVGAVHEYFTPGDFPTTRGHITGLKVRTVGETGGVRTGRYERDLELLRAELGKKPDDTRSQFYLAQTLRDLGRHAEAAAAYRKRAEMGGWVEEIYYSLYQAAKLDGDTFDMLRAFAFRPGRVEAAYAGARQLREQGMHEVALAVCRTHEAKRASAAQDVLFVEKDARDWGVELEHSLAAYYTGDVNDFSKRCIALLTRPTLPARIRTLVQQNLAKFGGAPAA